MESIVTILQKCKRNDWRQIQPSYLNVSTLTKNIYCVGFIDYVENHNLVVGCKPSYTSLSLEELDESGKLTPLDVLTPVYESSIGSCSFNDSSNIVCVSTTDCDIHLWDIHTQSDVRSFRSEKPILQWQRYIQSDTWIGSNSDAMVLVDSRDGIIHPFSSFSNIQSFSLSSDKNLLAVATPSVISIYDVRSPYIPLYSMDIPADSTVNSICWNYQATVLAANCGDKGVYQWNLLRNSSQDKNNYNHISVSNNHLNRWNTYVDDVLVLGSDNGVITCYDTESTLLHSSSVSSSPIVSILPLSSSMLPSSFLLSTDTDLSLLSYESLPFPCHTTLREVEEEEEPDVVRMNEPIAEAEEWMLQGQQSDYSRCSYDQFGACRQQVFVCRTCRDQYDRLLLMQHPEWNESQLSQCVDVGYLCEQCAHFCHTLRGHDVVALGAKNNVTCDCGNGLFRRLDQLVEPVDGVEIPSLHSCSLYPEKEDYNIGNHYSHNCRERYCYCDKEESLPMVQCIRCCDWFHNECAQKHYRETHNGQSIDLNDESIDYICGACEGLQSESTVTPPVPVTHEQIQEEVKEEMEEEDLEEMIQNCRKKNDRAGAMRMIMRYMLKKSLNQSTSSNRSIIVETDVNKAKKDIERIVKKLQQKQ